MTDPLWLQEEYERQRDHKSPPHRRVQCRTWWEAAGDLWAAAFMHGWF